MKSEVKMYTSVPVSTLNIKGKRKWMLGIRETGIVLEVD